MKHFQIPLAAAAATMLLAASCSVKENRIQCQAPVTVAVSTFSVSQEDIPLTQAQSVAESTVLNTINVPAVPFKRNGATFLTGSLYSANSQASFAVETGFESDLKIDF